MVEPVSLWSQNLPQVAAVLTLSDPRLLAMAKKATTLFLHQTYDNKRLIIANASGVKVVTNPHPYIEEVALPVNPEATRSGLLHAVAANLGQAEWLLSWDADTASHAHRITFQMAHRREGHGSLLTHQTRYDHTRRTICVKHQPNGEPSTMLFPREELARLNPSLAEPFDLIQLRAELDAKTTVLCNHLGWFPGPVLQMAIRHDLSVCSAEEFLGEYSNQPDRIFGLDEDHIDYLCYALKQHHNVAMTVVPRSSSIEPASSLPA